ncbi:MAG TPA: VanZ family protein [Candidatus Limnocylindrales bacterium]|nr:VanZ family protein [Candidatus Limnocylindrales bacterium]
MAIVVAVVFLVMTGALWKSRKAALPNSIALQRSALDSALVITAAVLAIIVFAPVESDTHEFNVLPFRDLVDAFGEGGFRLRDALFEVIANFAVFVPLGILVAMRFDRLRVTTWLARIFAVVLVSEILQSVVVGRSGDLTDVITDVAGAFAGFAVTRLVLRRLALGRADRVTFAEAD